MQFLFLSVAEVGKPETSGQDTDNNDCYLGDWIIPESAGHVARWRDGGQRWICEPTEGIGLVPCSPTGHGEFCTTYKCR